MKIAYIDINADIDKEIKQIKLTKDVSDSVIEAHGMHLLSKLTGLLPALVSKLISLTLSKKVSLVYQKFPALKSPLVYTGKKSKSFMILAPMLGCLNPSVSVVFHERTMKLLCLSDVACIAEPQLLVKMFDKNVETLLAKEASNK